MNKQWAALATAWVVGMSGSEASAQEAWVIGQDREPGGFGVHRYTGTAWAKIPGGALRVSVGPEGHPWVLNEARNLFRWNGGGWDMLPTGAANDIGIGADGSVWVVGTVSVPGGNDVWRWTGTAWSQVPGGGVAIDVGPDGNAWLVNNQGAIFRYTGATWVQIPGGAKDIGVGADGSVWVIGTRPVPGGYEVFRYTGNNWQNVPGGATRIDVGPDGNPWIVNDRGSIFRFVQGTWVAQPGLAYDIGVGGTSRPVRPTPPTAMPIPAPAGATWAADQADRYVSLPPAIQRGPQRHALVLGPRRQPFAAGLVSATGLGWSLTTAAGQLSEPGGPVWMLNATDRFTAAGDLTGKGGAGVLVQSTYEGDRYLGGLTGLKAPWIVKNEIPGGWMLHQADVFTPAGNLAGDGRDRLVVRSQYAGDRYLGLIGFDPGTRSLVTTRIEKNTIPGGWNLDLTDEILPVGDLTGKGPTSLLIHTRRPGQQWVGLLGYDATSRGLATRWLTASPIGGWILNAGDLFTPMGDLRGDGRTGILVQSQYAGDRYLAVLGTDGGAGLTGVWGTKNQIPGGWALNHSDTFTPIGDLDGDGRDDLVVQSRYAGDAYLGVVSFDPATNTLQARTVLKGTVPGGWYLHQADRVTGLGDLDGDGRSEVVIQSAYDGQAWVGRLVWDPASGNLAVVHVSRGWGNPLVTMPQVPGNVTVTAPGVTMNGGTVTMDLGLGGLMFNAPGFSFGIGTPSAPPPPPPPPAVVYVQAPPAAPPPLDCGTGADDPGCFTQADGRRPMEAGAYRSMMTVLKAESSSISREELIEKLTAGKLVTARQFTSLLDLFASEISKMSITELLVNRITDKENAIAYAASIRSSITREEYIEALTK